MVRLRNSHYWGMTRMELTMCLERLVHEHKEISRAFENIEKQESRKDS